MSDVRDVQKAAAELIRRYGAVEAGYRVGCSRQMVSAVAAGKRNPSAKLAAAILAAATTALPEPLEDDGEAGLGPTVYELERTVRAIDKALAEMPAATARAALLRARLDALGRIADLRGERDLTEAQVLRSKPWRTLMARIAPILERHPEVAAEMASALEAAEGEHE